MACFRHKAAVAKRSALPWSPGQLEQSYQSAGVEIAAANIVYYMGDVINRGSMHGFAIPAVALYPLA